jgi:hypothetical protein
MNHLGQEQDASASNWLDSNWTWIAGLAGVVLLVDMLLGSDRAQTAIVHASPAHRRAMDKKWGYHYSVRGRKVKAR